MCGANLAFRKDRLLSVGAFRTDLGRIGDRLIGGEESLVIRLLLRAGFEVIYEPSVAVKHRIHAERLSISWIGKRAYWEGVTEVAMVKATGEHFPPNLAVSKLAASALIFHGLFFATRNPDFLIRAKIAAGALTRRRALNLPT